MRGPPSRLIAALVPLALGCGVADHPVIWIDCTLTHEDANQQVRLPPGARSHWLQPWRAYQDTWPAQRLLDGLGYFLGNTFLGQSDAEREATVRALAEAGVRRATLELSWNHLDFGDPTRITLASARTMLSLFRRHGLRPNIMLNSHEGGPVPAQPFGAVLVRPAPRGATEVEVDAATLGRIVVGRSGLDDATGSVRRMAGILFVDKDPASGRVKLSRPLPVDFAAGTHPAHLLRYAPFHRPRLRDGRPNPVFEETMQGWVDYVQAVARTAREILGHDGFDVQVWYASGPATASTILDVNRYHDPPLDLGPEDPYEVTTREIVRRTVDWFRRAGPAFAGVRVVDGFLNNRWSDGATWTVPGVAAIGRVANPGRRRFPQDLPRSPSPAVNAQFQLDGSLGPDGNWREAFTPGYDVLLPEHYLTALPAENLIVDLSRIPTVVRGRARGRDASPDGGEPPALWLTALSLGAGGAALTTDERAVLRAKAMLRSYAAHLGKGAEAVFLSITDMPLGDPDDRGLPARALAAFTGAFAGAERIARPRAVRLASVSECGRLRQFAGGGTAAHPPLYDRELVAFFPFEVTPRRIVAPVYVMTRDLLAGRGPGGYPETTYALEIRGVAGTRTTVTATDPLTGTAVRVEVLSASGDGLAVAVPLVDSPRLLTIEER